MDRRSLAWFASIALLGNAFAAPVFADDEPSFAADQARNMSRIEQALDAARKKHNVEGEADALFDLGVGCIKIQQLAKAEDYVRQSLALEEKLNRPANVVQARQILASILQSQGKMNDAMDAYNQALAQAQSAKLEVKVVDVLLCMAKVEIQRRNYPEADKYLKQASDMASAQGDTLAQAQCLGNMAVIARAKNDNGAALEYLKKATALIGDSNRLAQGSLLMQSGGIKADVGAYDEAVDLYLKAQKDFEEAGDLDRAATALLMISTNYLALQNAEQSAQYAKKALDMFGPDGSASMRAQCAINIGSAEADLGNFSQAEKYHSQAVELSRTARSLQGELLALTETGYDQLLQGNLEKALNNFYQAYMYLLKNTPNREYEKALLMGYTGMCYGALGQTQAAVKYHEDSAEIFARLGKICDQAMAYNSIAVAYLDSNNFAQFETYFNKAKELLDGVKDKSLKDKLSIAYLDYNYAQACVLQGRAADAIANYERALATYHDAHDAKNEGRVLRGLGLAYLTLNESDKALDSYKKAKVIAEQSRNMEAQWDCAVGLGKAYKRLGDAKSAEANLREAVQLVEQERRQLSRDAFKTFNMDWRQDCFVELVDLLASSNRVEEALECVEKGRSRAFLDMLEGRRKGRLPNDAVARVSSTPDEVAPARRLDASNLVAMAGGGDGMVRSVDVLPKAHSLVEASAISPITAAPLQLDELKNLVKKSNSYFVEYYVLPSRVLIFVIKPTGEIQLAPPVVIDRRQLAEKIKAAQTLVTVPPKSMKELNEIEQRRQKALQELHALLVQPVVAYLPKSSEEVVTIVPHGPLFSVPFAALLSGAGRYLIEDHTLAYVPAIGVLRATQKLEAQTPDKKDTLLAFGNPITKAISFLGALPYAEKEAKAVANLFGTGNYDLEVGEKANKAAFRNLAPKYSVIHLATHGLIDEERPMDSALVLAPEGADDGLLTVKDILQMPPLKAHLCVLSACQTGRGKITGDGVVGLSRAFIIAGTPSILVSQWNVDDVMTEFQMKEFYTAYLGGADKAKALRTAQLKTIAFMEKTASASPKPQAIRANPRYWSAFQLIGEHK
jgi:CHAT domain-containing protein/tetratricopeptide (TPR) repeat protein